MKPIFIVRFPNSFNVEEVRSAAENLAKQGLNDDYHTLILKDKFTNGEIKFECFNAPHSELEWLELKNYVISVLNEK